VEAVTPVTASDHGAISTALDLCIARIQQVSVASGLAAKQSLELLTHEKLPLSLPVCRRNLAGTEWLDFFVYESQSNEIVRYVPADFDAEMLSRLGSFLQASARSEPIYGYLELQAEAGGLMFREGDTRTSVIMAATACEVILDLFLLALLWEQSVSASEAADLFKKENTISRRVRKLYHPRVGGNWHVDQDGPIRKWFEEVANLRNRCAHSGYRPSREEAFLALDSADSLRQFIVGRLKDPSTAKRFPATASMFLESNRDMSLLKASLQDWITWNDQVSSLRRIRSTD
jgi:hypothetical protein